MSELLLDKIREILEPIINDQGLLLDNLKYVKKGREYYLEIYVEKEDDVTTLDEVCAVSDLLSKKLDEVDLIQDNYVLDVSTSGAEKPIKDFSLFPKYVGKYVFVDGTGYKLTTGEKPNMTEYGFVGHIYEVAANGNYRIWVDKNAQVYA